MNTEHNTWATAALQTFLRRVFTQLAIQAEQRAKAALDDAAKLRAVLARVR